MPSALTEVILHHVTFDELERRRRSAESQTLSTQLAAGDKTDGDVFVRTASFRVRETSCEDVTPSQEFEPRFSDGDGRNAHDLIIRAARTYHRPICAQHSRHPPRQVAATQLHAPMLCLDIHNFEWQHPQTRRKSRGTCIVCCFTYQHVIVIHEAREPNVEMGNCSAKEVIRALTLRWLPCFGRLRLVRTDPECCFIYRQQLHWLSEQRILGSSQPGEAHWRTSTVERRQASHSKCKNRSQLTRSLLW